jgi:hypothetical protein
MSLVWKSLAALAAFFVMTVGTASAQVCGDADGSGTITVTDGVQTLRAAAGLSSSCASGACDVDGSGSVTVTDGVNVLRKAAGIAIIENCPGDINGKIENLLNSSFLIFGALSKTPSADVGAAAVEACQNDGTRDVLDTSVQFSNCELDGLIYNGTISSPSDGVIEFASLEILDPSIGETVTIESGSLSVTVFQDAIVFSGPLRVSVSTFAGVFSITFIDVAVDLDGFIIDGAIEFDVTDAGIPGVVAIRLGLTDSQFLPVTVVFDDQSTLDLRWGRRHLAALVAAIALCGDASALTICGDADGDGNVTITDGVRALRVAAGLTGPCTADCDLDGNGHVTISDGVNILRIAAALNVDTTCNQRKTVGGLIGDTLPIFGAMTKVIATGATGIAMAAGTGLCENPEGTVEFRADGFLIFHDCALDGFKYEGSLGVKENSLILESFSLTDLSTNIAISFDGELTAQQVQANSLLSGAVRIIYSIFPGEIPLTLDHVAFSNGTMGQSASDESSFASLAIGGSIAYDSSSAAVGTIDQIEVGFNGTGTLPVTLSMDDGTRSNLIFDARTEGLAPIE